MADVPRVGVVRFGAATSRRRRHDPVPRTNRVTVRLSDEEYSLVLANAAAARLAAAAYLAEVGAAPLVPARPGDDERAAMLVELMGLHRQVRGAANNLNQAVTRLNALGEPAGDLPATADYMRRLAARVDAVVAAIAAQQPGRR